MNGSDGSNRLETPDRLEVSFADVCDRLWRRRGFVLSVAILATFASVSWSLFTSVSFDPPIVYYVELRGTTAASDENSFARREYPNGAAFSPQDLLLPDVLEALIDELGLDASPSELQHAIDVQFGSPLASAVIAKYNQRLANLTLSPVEIDQISDQFGAELRAVSGSALRIQVQYALLGLSLPAGRQVAEALPRVWSDVFREHFRIYLPTQLPSFDLVGPPSFDSEADILRTVEFLEWVRRALVMLSEDSRVAALTTSSGATANDLLFEISNYETLMLDPILQDVFRNETPVARSYRRNLQAQIDELDHRIEIVDDAVRDIQGFRGEAATRSRSDTRDTAVLQLDESSLQQIMALSGHAQLIVYLGNALEERRDLANESARMKRRLARIDAPESAMPTGYLEHTRSRVQSEFTRLMAAYEDLLSVARSKLQGDQGQLFQPVGSPASAPGLVFSRLVLAALAAFLAGFLLAATVAVLAPAR